MEAQNSKNVEGLENFLQMMKGKSVDVLADPSGYIQRLSLGNQRKPKNSQENEPPPQQNTRLQNKTSQPLNCSKPRKI